MSTCPHQASESVGGLCPQCLFEVALKASEDFARFTPGTILNDRFQITALIGRGGMGEVYRADDLKLGQPVALKFVPLAIAQSGELLQRLYNEVRLGRQVAHPNVCRLFDLADYEGHPFIVMEFVDGENLESLLQRVGRLPQRKAIDIGREICAGLAASHDRDVIHGDLKPANIMIDGRGHARVSDFGLSALAADMTRRTLIAGTPAYMAPEQRKGQLSVRSDVYALGLVLEELTKGHRNIPSELKEKIAKCLAIDPANRPGSAGEVLAAFPSGDLLDAAVAAGETPSPDLVAATEPSIRLSRRVAWFVFAAVLIGMSIVVFTKERVSLEGRTPLPYSPAILARHARRIAGGVAADQASWFAADPSIRFYYRQSPKPMASNDPDGRVTLDEPPADLPGMVSLSMTPDGAIRPVVHVEEKTPLPLTVYYALLVPLIVAGAFVARRNIRSGRGDVRGALRIAAWVFFCRTLYWVFAAHHTQSFVDEFRIFSLAFAKSLMYAAEVWVGYLAVEPYIRRRRPKTIIGWKRLLEGRWNDPIVARDLLLGAGFGVAMVLLEELRRAVPGAAPFTAAVPALASRLSWLELLFYFQTRAIFYSLFGLFLLLLLRAVFRRTLIASAVWVIALAVLLAQAGQKPLDYILGASLALILLLVLNRYGLLTCAVAFFWYLFLTSIPLTIDVHRWYIGTTIAVAVLFATSLIVSLRAALTAV
jgi:hypothetical protein